MLGSQLQSAVMRSMASGEAFVMILLRGVGENWGKRKLIADASFTPSGQFCIVGVPITLQIL